jgi:excisionase family DNA binding protein
VAERRFLTVPEVAERLSVKESFIRRLIFEKRVPYTKFGGRTLRIAEDDLDAFIEARRVEPVDRYARR